jgi:hypothetical protein
MGMLPQAPIGGMSYTPGLPSQMPPAPQAPVDPRLNMPQGSFPAAPPKNVQTAWNVPPMGGSIPAPYGDLFGTWGTNRPQPPDPNGGANPGTIHSQTASSSPSFDWGSLRQNVGYGLSQAQQGIKQVADIRQKYGDIGIAIAAQALKNGAMGSSGGAGGGGMGKSPGDNFYSIKPPNVKKPKPPPTASPPLATSPVQAAPPSTMAWQFPQYSQTWVFTPPAPTPYMSPAPFDPKKYGDPFKDGKKGKNGK